MCGIAGWIDFRRDFMNDTAIGGIMDAMSLSLAPRGPDESGSWISESCCFMHRRLAVIDPDNGKQPMKRNNGISDYVICYNGELYNTEEIRAELVNLGYSFEEHSDTEVLLTAYMAWGEKCLDYLNGIYAFAVWDKLNRTLFLARDRIGVKPLFYYEYSGGIVFASEIKALLKHPMIKPRIGRTGRAELVLLGPAHLPDSGIFEGVKQLKPAEFLRFSDGISEKITYWSLKAAEHRENFEETAEHIRGLLTDSIKRQLVSDVPLCTFLSGGLDSSIISAVAAKTYQADGKTLCTYSVDYKGNRENFRSSDFQPDEDAPWIVKMSSYIGSLHKNVVVDTAELADALCPSVIAHDLPGMADVDSSLYLFCREVKKSFTVAVSGECADELFGGYPWYHKDEILFSSGFPWSRATNERNALLREGVLGDIGAEEFVGNAAMNTIKLTSRLDGESARDNRMREMFMLNFYWFMQVLLSRKDNMSMAHGLEVRVPFCDHRIAEYAYNIPWEFKAYRGREKGLLRYAMADLLPEGIAWRKKSPYPKTHNPLYMSLMLKKVKEICDDKNSRITEIFSLPKLRELVSTECAAFGKNWYGQLMTAPQMLAYLVQFEYFMEKYNVELT